MHALYKAFGLFRSNLVCVLLVVVLYYSPVFALVNTKLRHLQADLFVSCSFARCIPVVLAIRRIVRRSFSRLVFLGQLRVVSNSKYWSLSVLARMKTGDVIRGNTVLTASLDVWLESGMQSIDSVLCSEDCKIKPL